MSKARLVQVGATVWPVGVWKSLLRRLKDRLLLNAGYLFGVTLVSALSGFLFWTLAARLYDAQQVGLASSMISIIQLLAGIACLGLGTGLIRLLPESDDPVRFLNVVLTLTIVLGLLCGGIYLLGIQIWSPSLRVIRSNPLFAAGFLLFLITSVVSLLLPRAYLSLRQAKYAVGQIVVQNGTRLTLVVALMGMGGMGIILAVAVGIVAADVLGLWFFLPRLDPRFRARLAWSTDIVRRVVPFSIGNYASDLLYQAPILLAPPLALERLGYTASAHAYIAWMIGSLLASPGMALSQSAFAEGSKTPRELSQILKRAGGVALGVTIPLAVAAGVGAPWILRIFGESYASEATSLLRWLARSAPFMSIVYLYFSALRVRKELLELLVLSALVGGVTLLFPLFAIESFRLNSMGMAWFSAQGLVSVYAGFRLVRERLGRRRLQASTAAGDHEGTHAG